MTRKNKGGGSKDSVDAKETYRVGYGRPPRDTQFKPNQSGNPKGRPRRALSLRAVVEKVLEERIEIREGERVLRMSNRQALARTAVRRALNGDPKLLRALLPVLRLEFEVNPVEADADKTLSTADEAILADFIARHAEGVTPRTDRSVRAKLEPMKPLVSPDSGGA